MEKIIEYIKNRSKFFDSLLHGLKHWKNVEKIGHHLANINGTDKELITLFAYIHDLGRENEDEDVGYGERSVTILEDLYNKKIINIKPEKYQKLIYACRNHDSKTAQSDDLNIQTCWDADRLDLWRIGIEPNPKFLFTKEAKNPEITRLAKHIAK